MMMKIVEPYMIIMSPPSRTSTLSASAAASTVPTMTGVPAERPVSSAASSVTLPAMSVVQASAGSESSPTMSVKAVQAHGGPASKTDVAARRHVGRIGGECDVGWLGVADGERGEERVAIGGADGLAADGLCLP